MYEQLKKILKELTIEFSEKKAEFLRDARLSFSVRVGEYAVPGSTRAAKSHTSHYGQCLETGSLIMILGLFMRSFQSTIKLYDFIVQQNLWHEQFDSYEQSQNMMPSMTTKIGGGFLCRNFVINNNRFEITDVSFDQAFKELVQFFEKDHVNYDLYIHLRGVCGDISPIELSNQISIEKVNFEIARFFSISYYLNQYNDLEMFEGDYVLKIKVQVPKTNFSRNNLSKHNLFELQLIEKWSLVPILAIPGYVEIGKAVRFSTDWPLSYSNVIGPFNNHGTLQGVECTTISDELTPRLKSVVTLLEHINNLDKLDSPIRHSIERLTKSKSAKDINERAVDLAIAFEYLIKNKTKQEITVQLSLKSIKLFDEDNLDELIFGKLKDFYGLRSTVIHGSNKLKLKDKALIDFAEGIIMNITTKMIELNHENTFEEINHALEKSLYINKSISELLKPNVSQQ